MIENFHKWNISQKQKAVKNKSLLDIAKKIYENEGVRNMMEAWLIFLSSDDPEVIVKLMEEMKMNKLFYPAVFHREGEGFWVSFPDFPECFTEGDNMELAYEMAVEALGLAIKTLSIPEWLNEEAMALGVNFSQVLQEALMLKLKVK